MKKFLLAGYRRGLTLVEVAMVLVIIALVVAGVMMLYQSASSSQRTSEAVSQLGQIQQTVRSLYSGQSDFAGLNTASIAGSNQLPSKMVSGANLRHAFNDAITLAPTAANSRFTISFANIPQDACAKLVTLDLGTGMTSIKVGAAAAIPARPLTPAEAAAQCAGPQTIVWTFLQ